MARPSTIRPLTPSPMLALLSIALVVGCESTHETYEGDRAPDTSASDLMVEADPTADAGADQPFEEVSTNDVVEAYCDDAQGITVSGTVVFEGEVPSSARLWLLWMEEIGQPGFPPCFDEIDSFEFPMEFRMIGVPRSETWSFVVLLETDGLAIPIPGEGDFWAAIPGDEIDLSSDVTGLVLELEAYSP